MIYDELSEVVAADKLPPVPQNPDAMQQAWLRDGVLILPDFLDHDAVDRYAARWLHDHKSWRPNVPYMHVKEVRDLALSNNLMAILASLTGDEMALNLCLINWTSTERNFHQDSYINPDYINNHYLACWFALADIHPDSGPFEYVPGTHLWPLIRRNKVLDRYPPGLDQDPNWPAHTEPLVVGAIEEKLAITGLPIRQFLAKKGDLLIWSGSLVHRGSYPKVRGMERRALICHYSSIAHRLDMPTVAQHENQGKYFVL